MSPVTPPEREDQRRSTMAERRRAREREIIDATRTLFDERGVREAQIEDIARVAGINRAIVYRHFAGKEEVFSLTLVSYLDQLAAELAKVPDDLSPIDRMRSLIEAFVDFGLQYPAFVDCAHTVMGRTGPELLDQVSEGALFRLGRAIAACLRPVTEALRRGQADGTFAQTDPDVFANTLYAAGLGAMQLARIGMLVTEAAPGTPMVVELSTDQVRQHIIDLAMRLST